MTSDFQLGSVDKILQVTVLFPPDFVAARLTPALKAGEQQGASIDCGHENIRKHTRWMQRNVAAFALAPRQSKKFLVTS